MTDSSNERNSIKLYDKALYWYLYFWLWVDYRTDQYQDYRANIRWMKNNKNLK
jgi:hypothetical protein